jgi:hypothetical protein
MFVFVKIKKCPVRHLVEDEKTCCLGKLKDICNNNQHSILGHCQNKCSQGYKHHFAVVDLKMKKNTAILANIENSVLLASTTVTTPTVGGGFFKTDLEEELYEENQNHKAFLANLPSLW